MINISYNDFFSALSCDRRLDILQALRRKDAASVTEIAELTDIEQSAVSHNLKLLLECELVHLDIRGRQRFYSLNDETVGAIFRLVDKHMDKYCGKCECGSKSVKKERK